MKTRSNSSPLMKLAFACLALGLSSSYTACVPVMAAEQITSKVTIQSTTKEISNEDWRNLSLAAAWLLKHTDQAQLAITVDKDPKAALEHVEKALTLVKIIEIVLPPVKVDAEITAGDIVYKDEDLAYQVLIPVYNEMIQYDILSPVARAKNQTRPELVQAGVDYSTEYLDVNIAKRFLITAKQLLTENKPGDAGASLTGLFANATVFENTAYELPISKAARYISMAEKAFSERKDEQASQDLREASDAISDFIKSAHPKDRVLVEQMRTDIDSLADVIHDQARRATTGEKLRSTWHELTSWMRRAKS